MSPDNSKPFVDPTLADIVAEDGGERRPTLREYVEANAAEIRAGLRRENTREKTIARIRHVTGNAKTSLGSIRTTVSAVAPIRAAKISAVRVATLSQSEAVARAAHPPQSHPIAHSEVMEDSSPRTQSPREEIPGRQEDTRDATLPDVLL